MFKEIFNLNRLLVSVCVLTIYFMVGIHSFKIAAGQCPLTERTRFHTECARCSFTTGCPPGTIKLSYGRGKSDCRYPLHRRLKKFSIVGCRHLCLRETKIPNCCPGYWGSNCDRCPGSLGPCNGNGICNDTIEGTGQCTCEPGFEGYACEQCSNNTVFGEKCDLACLCVHGKCDNGVHGTGECDCESGYEGTNCDEWIEGCTNKTCQPHSRCKRLYGVVMCSCDIGYTNVNGSCEEINACEEKTNCDENAICTPTGPNIFNCTCSENYQGDGFECDAVDPCQTDSGGCVTNSSMCVFKGPGQSECQCLEGFEGYKEGYGCNIIDVCVYNRSSCHKNATCKTTGPQQFKCTCNEGYGGDGVECFPNIVERVKALNRDDPHLKNNLNRATAMLEHLYKKEFTDHGPFTVFLPTDRGFRTVLRAVKTFDGLLADEEYAKQILRQHIIVGDYTLEDLSKHDRFYTLQGVPAGLYVRFNRRDRTASYRYRIHGSFSRANVVKGNLQASNGVIHVIGKILTITGFTRGNNSVTIYDQIKSLTTMYNITTRLIDATGMQDDFRADNITVFPIQDTAWLTTPSSTVEHLLMEQGLDAARTILRHTIYDGVFEVADLINMNRIRSHFNTETTLSVTPVGQIMLNKNISITQADIPASNGLFHHISGVLSPTDIMQLLPSWCIRNVSTLIQGPCGPCHRQLKCERDSDELVGSTLLTNCTYDIKMDQVLTLSGCSKLCNRTETINECCSGFYGNNCENVCPGGFMNPCHGNGKCHPDGTCICNEGYGGPDCGYCADESKFGANCTQSCTCVHGTCDNRIGGTGECRRGSCHFRILSIGNNCDMVLKACPKGRHICHTFSRCAIFNETTQTHGCICDEGYEGDGATSCTEINPCEKEERGGCHQQATCIKTGPGMNRCECEDGWVGDGTYCYRGSECAHNNTCHERAECRTTWGSKKTMCVCREGFHGNGTDCVPNDQCEWDMGGCDLRARCIPTGPGTNNCTCWDGYGGDGRTCIPTISKLIQEHPNLTMLAEFLKKLDANYLLSMGDKFTLFAPSDDAMRLLMKRVNKDYWKKDGTILNFFRFHTVFGLNSMAKLKMLVPKSGKFETMFDGFYIHVYNDNNKTLLLSGRSNTAYRTNITFPDLVAVNGFVHVIDRALETLFTPDDSPSIVDFFAKYPQYSYFGDLLRMKGVLDDIANRTNEYTLFVPPNNIISKFYNASTVTKKFLQYYIIPSIRLLESFDNKENVDSFLGPRHRLSFLVMKDKVFVNEAPVTKGDMLTWAGVVHEINGLLVPVLHRCDVKTVQQEYGPCVSCFRKETPCPELFDVRIKNSRCKITRSFGSRTFDMIGCKMLCGKENWKRECCDGYYGEHCRECPGGPEFPCNHNGNCTDGVKGGGECVCNPGYAGHSCEFCIDGNTTKPCSRTCRYNNGGCSLYANCTETNGQTSCRCWEGYVGDGSACDRPCDVDNGGCYENATCEYLIQENKVNCTCPLGMVGDGIQCDYPVKVEKITTSSTSDTGMIVGITLGLLALVGIIVAAALVILWKRKKSGIMEIWSRVRKDSSGSFSKLHTSDDDNSSVSQPLSPTNMDFDNPLYNIKGEF